MSKIVRDDEILTIVTDNYPPMSIMREVTDEFTVVFHDDKVHITIHVDDIRDYQKLMNW